MKTRSVLDRVPQRTGVGGASAWGSSTCGAFSDGAVRMFSAATVIRANPPTNSPVGRGVGGSVAPSLGPRMDRVGGGLDAVAGARDPLPHAARRSGTRAHTDG